jgi:hypothetical protein
MSFTPFVFNNNWQLISYSGQVLLITDSDLKSYEQNDMSESEIKSVAYSYLTSIMMTDFTKIETQHYEF